MSVVLAMIPLGPGAKLSRSKLAQHLVKTWDDVLEEPEIEKGEGVLSFEHGESNAMIALMPAPIPASDLEGPISTSWLWPEAKDELAKHRGHLIVTILAANEQPDPIEQRKVLTQVVSSVLATSTGALGVYWGEAGLLIGSKLFVEMATDLLPESVPLPLWVDFRVGPVDHESGLSFGFTDGLANLGLMELVTENATDSPGELRERLMSIADYLMTNGMVIEDGHTVGEDNNERITVTFGPSPFGHEGQVMRLDYTSKKKKRSWFGRG